MAGGAGASMAGHLPHAHPRAGVDPRLMGMFLVTPDIFESLDDSAVTGTRANALAMLGEIVASQTGSARVTDVELLRALGHENGEASVSRSPVSSRWAATSARSGRSSATDAQRGVPRPGSRLGGWFLRHSQRSSSSSGT